MTQRVPLSPRLAVSPSEVTVTPSLTLNTGQQKPEWSLHFRLQSSRWFAFVFNPSGTTAGFIPAHPADNYNQESPRSHPSLSKPHDRESVQNSSCAITLRPGPCQGLFCLEANHWEKKRTPWCVSEKAGKRKLCRHLPWLEEEVCHKDKSLSFVCGTPTRVLKGKVPQGSTMW